MIHSYVVSLSPISDLWFTENLRDQWHRYEEYYDELSHWIKDTEADMKADSEQKATFEDKMVQLDKQRVRT